MYICFVVIIFYFLFTFTSHILWISCRIILRFVFLFFLPKEWLSIISLILSAQSSFFYYVNLPALSNYTIYVIFTKLPPVFGSFNIFRRTIWDIYRVNSTWIILNSLLGEPKTMLKSKYHSVATLGLKSTSKSHWGIDLHVLSAM